MDYKKMKDEELATIMVNLIERVEKLEHKVSTYLDSQNFDEDINYEIHCEYRALKDELREKATYVNRVANHKGTDLYMRFYAPSIAEAAAFGFMSHTNAKIDQRFFSSVDTALYKLTKYKSYDEWKNI